MNAQKKIAVIGGGIMGLASALELAQRGAAVTVLDQGAFGQEASRASAGMIGPQSEAMENDAYFQATLASRDMWPEYAKDLAEKSGLDFGFQKKGAIHLAFGAAYEKRLEARYLWQKKAAGNVTRVDREETHQRWPWLSPRVSGAFFADGDYWLDNEKLMDALTAACRYAGVVLREYNEVLSIETAQNRATGIKLAGGETLKVDAVLLAAGAWASKLLDPFLQKGQAPRFHPVKGQMLEFNLSDKLHVDLPIHAEFVYLVPRPGKRLVVGATVETVGFDKTMTGEGLEWLLQGAFETIPDLRLCEVGRLWAGLRPGASDGWPSLGESHVAGLFLAAGHYRRGILFAPLTAKALAEAMLGGGLPEYAQAFNYQRHLKTGAVI